MARFYVAVLITLTDSDGTRRYSEVFAEGDIVIVEPPSPLAGWSSLCVADVELSVW